MIADVIRFKASSINSVQNILVSQQTLQRALYSALSVSGQAVETSSEIKGKSGGIKVSWQTQKSNCSLTITQRQQTEHITTTFENSQGITHIYDFVHEIIIYPPGGQVMVENRMGQVMILSKDGWVKTGPKHEIVRRNEGKENPPVQTVNKVAPSTNSSWTNLLKDS